MASNTSPLTRRPSSDALASTPESIFEQFAELAISEGDAARKVGTSALEKLATLQREFNELTRSVRAVETSLSARVQSLQAQLISQIEDLSRIIETSAREVSYLQRNLTAHGTLVNRELNTARSHIRLCTTEAESNATKIREDKATIATLKRRVKQLEQVLVQQNKAINALVKNFFDAATRLYVVPKKKKAIYLPEKL